jgi:hypothetical protein
LFISLADVSMSFKKLQAERMAADQMIRDLTPLEGLHDTNGVRDFLQAMILKAEVSSSISMPPISLTNPQASRGEIKRLNVAVASTMHFAHVYAFAIDMHVTQDKRSVWKSSVTPIVLNPLPARMKWRD